MTSSLITFVSYLLVFATAAFLALILTPLAIILAKKFEILDYPGDRRIHAKPIPRLGGAAIFVSFWLVVFLSDVELNRMIFGFFLGSAIIFVVGLVDDMRDIRPLYKFLWQLLAAVIPLFFGLSLSPITIPLLNIPVDLGYLGYGFIVFWIVGLVNTVNISDGMDGLAAGICMIAALILFWAANQIEQGPASVLMLALAGATFGFLFFNFHPAKIFMGDSGSMFLGYILGAVSISGLLKTATILGLVFPLLVLGMPVTDVIFAIIRRSWRGLSIARADRGHLHHRLLDAGLTQRQAVLILYAISFCFGLAAVFCVYGNWYMAILLVLLNFGLILRIMFRKFHWHKRENQRKLYLKNRGNQ